MADLYLDLETFSTIPISRGTHAYAEEAEVLLCAYAWDGGPVIVDDVTSIQWRSYKPLLRSMIADAHRVIIQNSHFDRTVLRHGGIEIPTPKIVDTMVMALQHGLPGDLDRLCTVLKVPKDKAKDKAGKALIQLFCKPQPINRKLRRATSATHPEEWRDFMVYAGLDIEAMRAVRSRIPKWNYTREEFQLWLLDQKINDHGVMVDLDLAREALRAFSDAKQRLQLRSQVLTGGAVHSPTQRDKLLAHLRDTEEVALPDLTKGTIEVMLRDENLDDDVRELLTIRQQAAATSPGKYRAFINSASPDGRVRNTIQFCGASRTRRDAGRLVQLQNLPRPTLRPEVIEQGIRAIKAGCEDVLFDNVSELCVNAVRGCIIPAEGNKLVVADLSNIEGRIAAWIAGEEWKLEAFRAFDAGEGHDLYALSYARSFRVTPEDVMWNKKFGDGSMRQIGKVQELSLGYQGSVGAYVSMGDNYGVDPVELAGIVQRTVAPELWDRVAETYTKRWSAGLPVEVWTGIKIIVNAWREAHPEIKATWYELEDAARLAIRNPGRTYMVRGLEFDMVAGYLRIKLPSGQYLSYKDARVGCRCKTCDGEGSIYGFDEEARDWVEIECEDCEGTGRNEEQIAYYGSDQTTKQWGLQRTYGGKIFENVVQSTARDVFMGGLRRAMRAGYPVVLRVHDELVTETPDTPLWGHEALSALMAAGEPWTLGLPLAAAGHDLMRYSKGD